MAAAPAPGGAAGCSAYDGRDRAGARGRAARGASIGAGRSAAAHRDGPRRPGLVVRASARRPTRSPARRGSPTPAAATATDTTRASAPTSAASRVRPRGPRADQAKADQAGRRRTARKMASVPCRCGQNWAYRSNGSGQRRPGPRAAGRGVEHVDVLPAAQHGGQHVPGLGQMRRAGDVADHAAGPGRVQRRGEQGALQPGQRRQSRGRPAPAGLRPAPERAQAGARDVGEHPVEAPAARRRRPVGARTGARRGRRSRAGGAAPASRARCWRTSAATRRRRVPAASPASRPRLAARARRQVQPGRSGPVTSAGPGRAPPAGWPRPAPRPGPRARRGISAGSPSAR